MKEVIQIQSEMAKKYVTVSGEMVGDTNQKRITLITLGDRDKGFIPPMKWRNDFVEKIKQAMESRASDSIIINDPFVSIYQFSLPKDGEVLVVGNPAEPFVVTEDGQLRSVNEITKEQVEKVKRATEEYLENHK